MMTQAETDNVELDIADLATPLERGSTIIEASAGTGKTYTIAAIFLRLLVEEGLRGAEILVTTFTIPATAELRERIRALLRRALEGFRRGSSSDALVQALVEKHHAEKDAVATRLEAELQDFDQARIFTIHSFCQRVLGDCAFESGAAPQPEFLADERELVREVVRDFWRAEFYECEACLAAAASAARLTPGVLEDLLLLRLQKPLAQIIPPYDEGELEATRAALLSTLEHLRQNWPGWRDEIAQIFLQPNGWAIGSWAKLEPMRGHFAAVDACLTAESAGFFGYGSLAVFAPSYMVEERGVRKNRQPPEHPFCAACEQLLKLGETLRRLLEAKFVEWAPATLMHRKTQANVCSFTDLLLRVYEELHSARGEALATRLRAQYRAALIDEFQDTDAVQDGIFGRIFGEATGTEERARWLYLIGDPKQAIYGFRGADVFSYLAAARRTPRRRTLRTNWRSSESLVEGVNAIFSRNPRAFVAEGITFAPAQAAEGNAARALTGAGHPAPVQLWLWQGEGKANLDALRDELAAATAAEIARLLQSGATIEGRQVCAQDIAVLTASNFEASTVQDALREVNVPAAVLTTGSVFATVEAREMLALLAAMAAPGDERRVRAALLTGLLGLKASELEALEADSRGWEEWLERFHSWHEGWLRHGVGAALRRAWWQQGIRRRLAAQIGGERHLTNLGHVAELLQERAAAEQLAPAATVQWLAQRVTEAGNGERASEEAYELRLERDDKAVRIVTVHKSKGLQYEIVFCPFSWSGLKKPRENAKNRAAFHNPDGGTILDLGSPQLAENQARQRSEALAEQVRLLYVALTRARVRCEIALPFVSASATSAATWLLQAAPAEGARRTEALEEFWKTLTFERWGTRLAEVAAAAPAAIALAEVPSPEATPLPYERAAGARLQARSFTGEIERDFCVSSFSSLTAGADAELPEKYLPPGDTGVEPERPHDDIHAFPAGARSGLCLHAIFEEMDFTALETLPELVESKLRDFSLEPSRWEPVVTDCLRRVVQVPLAGGFSLAQIGPEDRLAETEFHLPAGRLEAPALRALFTAEEEPGGLDFAPRRGWLKGFIDLIFRHEGRYYVADWKSNRLGTGPAGYAPAGVAAAMRSHHYGLQAHLYGLALHRYLGARLPHYSFEQHFGGMFWIFLRGVDPARPELGVWQQRPSLARLQGLEKWLEGQS